MKNNFFVAQTSVNDCGFASLAMIFNLNEIKFNKETLKNELKRNKNGTSAYDLIKVAYKYGLVGHGYKNYEIVETDLPLIALEINENKLQHFVVVLKITNNNVLIADPFLGIVKFSKEEFYKKYTGISIVFNKSSSIKQILLRNKKNIMILICLSIFIALLSILFSYLLSFTLKMIELNKGHYYIYKMIFLFLLVGLFKEMLNFIKCRLSLKFQLLIDKVITLPVIEKLLNLPYEFYYQNGVGELISKVNDLSHIKEMVLGIVEILLVNVILVILTSFILLFIDIRLILINLFTFLILYIINKHFLSKNFYKTYDLQIKNEILTNSLTDVFGGILTIKNLSKENYAVSKINDKYKDVIKQYENLMIPFQKKEFLISFYMIIFNVLLVFFLVFSGFYASKIVFIISLENLIISSLNEIFKLQPLYFNFKSSYLRIKEIIDKKTDYDKQASINIKSIQFKNVIYSYGEEKVLNNISFNIKSGDWIMITGPTGSGKSTLFKLLTKQIKTNNDDILINDKSINDYDCLRNSITYVDQKAKLFNISLEENISFGKHNFLNAARIASVDDLIENKKCDYNYLVDNANANLSGGQIQKIIIAQTLFNGSNVIIFDETTSQLDTKTERKILSNIKKAYPKKTIILITHRDKNADLFDQKLIFGNGTVNERIEIKKHERIKQ